MAKDPYMVVSPNAWEVEAGRSKVQGKPPGQSEFVGQSRLHEPLWQNGDNDGDDNQDPGDGSVVKSTCHAILMT